MLKYNACEFSKDTPVSATGHDYTMYAIVHPDAVQCTDSLGGTYDLVKVLEDLNYQVKIWGPPIMKPEITDTYLRENVDIDAHFSDYNILNAYRLTSHQVAVVVSFDTFILSNVDDVYNTMISGTPSVGLQLDQYSPPEFPTNPIAMYTRDYYHDSPDYYNPVSLDFLAIKPNLATFNTLVWLLKNTPYVPDLGWGGNGVHFPGGMGPKGLLTYWILAQQNSVGLDYCIYNNHNWDPLTTDLSGNPECENRFEAPHVRCTDCRQTPLGDVKAITFFECGHPWSCQLSPEPRCQEMHKEWFTTRQAFEAESPYPATVQDGAYHPEVYLGYCTGEGPSGYKTMGYTEEFPATTA